VPGAALQADELGDVLEVLPEDGVFALLHHRNVAYAQREKPFAAAGVVRDVDDFVIYLLFRKKLFRSEAATSSGLRKKYEFVSDCAHMRVKPDSCRRDLSLLPAPQTRQAGATRFMPDPMI